MEYKAKRNFTRKGISYEKNQFVPIENEDVAKVLQERNFLQKRGKKTSKK